MRGQGVKHREQSKNPQVFMRGLPFFSDIETVHVTRFRNGKRLGPTIMTGSVRNFRRGKFSLVFTAVGVRRCCLYYAIPYAKLICDKGIKTRTVEDEVVCGHPGRVVVSAVGTFMDRLGRAGDMEKEEREAMAFLSGKSGVPGKD